MEMFCECGEYAVVKAQGKSMCVKCARKHAEVSARRASQEEV